MKRALPLAAVAVLAAGATALAQGDPDPYAAQEPDVTAGKILKLPQSAGGCNDSRAATVRVNPPLGAVLGAVSIIVDGRQAARLTGIPRAASATVRIPQSGARLTVRAETLGGQQLRTSRIYSDCTRPPDTPPPNSVGGGEG